MGDDKLVTVVGHSLVPRNLGVIPGANIRIYRSPGAKAINFEHNNGLNQVLNYPHDLTILFLGGNDVYDGCIPSHITTNIESVIEQIHEYCNSDIAFVLLEHRNPRPGNRFGVSADQYNRVASNINNRLKRKYRNKPYVKFISVGAKPFQHGVTDGVHFDVETQAHLTQKFRNTISRYINH